MKDRTRFLAELKAALDAIESEMPPGDGESQFWFVADPPAAADTFARLESETEILRRLTRELEDGVALELSTLTAAAARRSAEALYRILRDIEGMGYVGASGILADVLVVPDLDRIDDIDKVHAFLENTITQVRDEAHDSYLDVQDLETLKCTTAQDLCDEFAKEAADTIVTALCVLDDPIEADEWLGNADRSVFTDDILRRSVALVILGHMHMSVSDTYSTYEAAASRAKRQLDLARLRPMHNRGVNAGPTVEELKSAFVELLKAGRDAAAYRSASAALESCLRVFLDQ